MSSWAAVVAGAPRALMRIAFWEAGVVSCFVALMEARTSLLDTLAEKTDAEDIVDAEIETRGANFGIRCVIWISGATIVNCVYLSIWSSNSSRCSGHMKQLNIDFHSLMVLPIEHVTTCPAS